MASIRGKLQQAVRGTNAPVELVGEIDDADLLLTTKNFYRRKTEALRMAEKMGKPVYVLRRNTAPQIEQFIRAVSRRRGEARSEEVAALAIREAEEAAARVDRGENNVELNPQGAFIRHMQHQIAENYGLASSSTGRERNRHVTFYRR